MSNPAPDHKNVDLRARTLAMVHAFFGAVTGSLEFILSRRGLSVVFLVFAGALTLSGWVRPPLSSDISAVHIPLNLTGTGTPSAEDVLMQTHGVTFLNIGSLLLALLAIGVAVVLLDPKRIGMVWGMLLCAAIGANAAVVLNHPALFELLEDQFQQRRQMVRTITRLEEDAMADRSNGRIIRPRLGNEHRSDISRCWDFCQYGTWLLPITICGVVLGGRGRLPRRAASLGGWTLLGVALTCGLCSQRLRGEYHWSVANQQAARGDVSAARQAIRTAIALFPEFDRLERTWLLRGTLDYREKLSTPSARFFRATQLARLKEKRPAIEVIETLLADGGDRHPAVHNLAARLWTESGLEHFWRKASPEQTVKAGSIQRGQNIMAAQDAWQKSVQIAPSRFDSAFFLGITQAQTHKKHPESAEVEFAPLLARIADKPLRADILASLGDVYFEAGQFAAARQRYRESIRAFELTRHVNTRARKGLVGM